MCVPHTYRFLQLDAPSEVIHARKNELNAEDIASYRYDVFTMYLRKPSMLYAYINTANDIEQCSDVLIAGEFES